MNAPDPRLYAEDTKVPVERSKAEIEKILREHGCLGVQWTEDWTAMRTELRFIWPHEGVRLLARISVPLPSDDSLAQGCKVRHKDTAARKAWCNEQRAQIARAYFRILVIKLKADFNMVRAGLASTATVLLPFLEDSEGRTLGSMAIPRLAASANGGMRALLDGPKDSDGG